MWNKNKSDKLTCFGKSIPAFMLILLAFVMFPVITSAQVINRAEYFIDNDPGHGNATAIPAFTSGSDVNFSFNVPLGSLNNGFHIIGIRIRESVTGRWSHTQLTSFYIVPPVSFPTAANITAGEYFFDNDPGFGNGTSFSFTSSSTVAITLNNVAIGSLSPGFHNITFRVKDNLGKWTHGQAQSFYIIPPITNDQATSIVAAEYFFDNDLGVGNNTPLPVASGNTQLNNFPVPLPGTLSSGFHQIGFRYKDNKGRWSHADIRTFYIVPAPAVANRQIVAARYFVDDEFGNGTPVSITGIVPSSNLDQVVALDMTGVPTGSHTLSIQIKDSQGMWSYLETRTFSVSSCVPPATPTAPDVSRCNAGTVTLTATGAIGTQEYRWYDDPILSNIVHTGASFTTPELTNSKTYYVSIYDPGTACESGRITVKAVVIDIPKPNINPSGSITICEGNSFILSATTGFANYTWSNGLTSEKITVNTNGNYSVVVGDGTCSSPASDAISVIVSPKPAKPLVATSGTTDLCDGASVTLTAPAGFSYLWSSGQTSQSITVTTQGNYSVTVADGSNCPSDASDAVAVKTFTKPSKPVIEVIGSATLCGANTVGLLAPSGYTIYQWSGGQTTQIINVAAAGNYSVAVGNASNCLSVSSDAVNVTSTGQPCTGGGTSNTPPVIDSKPLATQIEGKVEVDLTALLTDVDNNIDFASLKVINGSTSRGISAFINSAYVLQIDYSGNAFTGTDRVTIEVCDLAGACAQEVIDIEVVGAVVVYNGLSPDGDGLNDFMLIKYIDVVEGASKNKVTIYNRWGDLVFEVNDYDNLTRVFTGSSNNGKELPSGTYFYKIDFSQGSPLSGYITLKR